MPMPLWIMFSPINCDAHALMIDVLPGFLAAHHLEPYETMPIVWEENEVLHLDAEARWIDAPDNHLDNMPALLAAGRGTLGISLDFTIPHVGRNITFDILDQQLPATLCLSIDRMILVENDDTFGGSGWLVHFLSNLANTLQCECVLSSLAVSQLHETINVSHFISRLKSGELFESGSPTILMVRDDLVSTDDISELMAPCPESGFQYKHHGTHHILWCIRMSRS